MGELTSEALQKLFERQETSGRSVSQAQLVLAELHQLATPPEVSSEANKSA